MNTFPPLKQLISESWNNLINKLFPILIFNSIALGITFLTTLIIIAVLTGAIFLGNSLIVNNNLLAAIPIIGGFILVFITTLLAMCLFQVGNILILNSAGPISYKAAIKQSLALSFPVTLGCLFISFLVFGGTILLIIPGIIFSILFQFTIFLMVLDRLKPKDAVKRSVFLVSKSFGQIFVRIVILFLISIAASILFSMVNQSNPGLATLANLLFSIFYTFFSISYMLTLFKEAKIVAGEGTSNIRFIFLVAVIGWILAIIIGGFSYRFISNAINQSNSLPNLAPLNSELSDYNFNEEALIYDDLEPATPAARPLTTTLPKVATSTPTLPPKATP